LCFLIGIRSCVNEYAVQLTGRVWDSRERWLYAVDEDVATYGYHVAYSDINGTLYHGLPCLNGWKILFQYRADAAVSMAFSVMIDGW
jgi:hypothetical protein